MIVVLLGLPSYVSISWLLRRCDFLGVRIRSVTAPVGPFAAWGAATSFLLAWALLNPPFQGPDEPDHMLTAVTSAGVPADVRTRRHEELARWAREAHFARLLAKPDEAFNPNDFTRPAATAWPDYVQEVDARFRSWLQYLSGRAVRPLVVNEQLPISWAMLALRLASATVVASLTLGILAFALRSRGGIRRFATSATLIMFFCAPWALFITHVSNHGFMAGTNFALAFLILIVALRGGSMPLKAGAGAFAGLLQAMSLSGGVASLAALGLVPLFSFVHRSAIEDEAAARSKKKRAGASAVFLFSWFAALSLSMIWIDPAYLDTLFSPLKMAPSFAPIPTSLLAVSCFFVIGLTSFLLSLIPSRSWGGASTTPASRVITRASAWALLLGLFAIPPLFGLLPLANAEVPVPPAPWDYARQAAVRFLFSLGSLRPDFYLAESFWSRFAWLETTLPWGLVWLLKSSPLFVPAAHAIGKSEVGSGEFVPWLLVLVSCAGMVAILAIGSLSLRANIHGRYLLLPYTILLLSCCFALRRWRPLSAVIAGCVTLLQMVSLATVLARFFS